MDVNTVNSNANIANARTYGGGFEGRTPNSATTIAIEPISTPDRPARNADRPERQGTPATVQVSSQVQQGGGASLQIENAPRLSELGSRVASDEDITDNLLEQAFGDANRVLDGSNFSLSYAVHEASGRVLVKVHDVDTGDVIREIPSEGRLDIYARITEFTGLLFDRSN